MIHICIPAHDEDRTIGVLLWKIRKVMKEFERDYHVLVLDDGSTDQTRQVLEPYGDIMPMTVLRNERPEGYGRSVERLIREVVERTSYPKRDSVVVMQADFTDEPASIVDLVKRIEGGADVVAGVPEFRGDYTPRAVSWVRRAWEYLFERFDHRSPVADPLTGMRAYRVITLKKALAAAGEDPLLELDGWAANAELAEKVEPHARRIEDVPVQIRYDRRTRGSRFHPLATSRQLFRLIRSATAIALLLIAGLGPVRAQNGEGGAASVPDAAVVPFGIDESMEYRVTVGRFGTVGEGSLRVLGTEDVRGHLSYHLRFDVEGGVAFAKVDDQIESWLDVRTLQSWRFKEHKKEVGHERDRLYEFHPEDGVWRRLKEGDEGPLASMEPLDDISFLYYVRTLPLEVGDTYMLNRYFKDSGNPVLLYVERKDTVTVDAGEFPVIVVEPVIRSSGLFGEGEAEIAFSDDERRLIVQLKSKLPLVGSLDLHLRRYQPGTPLRSRPDPEP